jgi:hypothetical protein
MHPRQAAAKVEFSNLENDGAWFTWFRARDILKSRLHMSLDLRVRKVIVSIVPKQLNRHSICAIVLGTVTQSRDSALFSSSAAAAGGAPTASTRIAATTACLLGDLPTEAPAAAAGARPSAAAAGARALRNSPEAVGNRADVEHVAPEAAACAGLNSAMPRDKGNRSDYSG